MVMLTTLWETAVSKHAQSKIIQVMRISPFLQRFVTVVSYTRKWGTVGYQLARVDSGWLDDFGSDRLELGVERVKVHVTNDLIKML
jgi:hypothetical protein